jgi:hypothetical protein
MNTYTRVATVGQRATHALWGEVDVLSKWESSNGHAMYRVSVSSEAGFPRVSDAIRYTDYFVKGGA